MAETTGSAQEALTAARDMNISCVHCVGENMKTCQGTFRKCSVPTEECVSVTERILIGEATDIRVFMRFCGNCSQQKRGSVRFDKGILKTNATCCNTDKCTPPEPIIPTIKPVSKDEKVKHSGRRCNSCYSQTYKACDCNVMVNCTIGETKCISRQLYAKKGDFGRIFAIRGCTTEEMCENLKDKSINHLNVRYSSSCSDDSDSVHRSLLLLVLTAPLFSMITTAT
ncbi:phospholipase A2 inhibitor 25 kDa subunit-like isoform X2 [Eleutherodactylus coqui]|uniref:phospholipase A2 inhibitor 25 kDa subunit-like isoform X2 n=1 Tax=Eleutherodactylus coqui TaxID=57060 RepID=UPI0034632C50